MLDPLLSWLELWKVLFLVRAGAWLDEVLGPLLSWLELWKVLFLVRAGAWLVFLLSWAMAGASTKVEIKHQPAVTAVM